MNYLERCLKRLDKCSFIAKDWKNHSEIYEFEGIVLNYTRIYEKQIISVSFRNVHVPLEPEESLQLFKKLQHKYDIQKKEHELFALKDL